jgi:hypothetical protein
MQGKTKPNNAKEKVERFYQLREEERFDYL